LTTASTGVCPAGAQVWVMCPVSPVPDSPQKQIQAPRSRPFYDLRPGPLHPLDDLGLIAFDRGAGGPLRGVADPPQQPPHPRQRGVGDAEPLSDHPPHPLERPVVSGEPVSLGAAAQHLPQLQALPGIQQPGAPGGPLLHSASRPPFRNALCHLFTARVVTSSNAAIWLSRSSPCPNSSAAIIRRASFS
jgi:hypothetical protein